MGPYLPLLGAKTTSPGSHPPKARSPPPRDGRPRRRASAEVPTEALSSHATLWRTSDSGAGAPGRAPPRRRLAAVNRCVGELALQARRSVALSCHAASQRSASAHAASRCQACCPRSPIPPCRALPRKLPAVAAWRPTELTSARDLWRRGRLPPQSSPPRGSTDIRAAVWVRGRQALEIRLASFPSGDRILMREAARRDDIRGDDLRQRTRRCLGLSRSRRCDASSHAVRGKCLSHTSTAAMLCMCYTAGSSSTCLMLKRRIHPQIALA